MATVIDPTGTEWDDGPYSGFCQRQKQVHNFPGVVWMDSDGRILATGPCESCHQPITTTLYYV